MRIAMLSPIVWRNPPRQDNGRAESVAHLARGLTERGTQVTLFDGARSQASGASHPVGLHLQNESTLEPRARECLHVSYLFEHADEFDLIHNHGDYIPLTYSGMTATPVLTTIYEPPAAGTLPVYKNYHDRTYYVSVSNAVHSPELSYLATIYQGIGVENIDFEPTGEDYLLFLGSICERNGTVEAIEIACASGKELRIGGTIEDEHYFQTEIKPRLDGSQTTYLGDVSHETKEYLLAHALALLHPINFDEPFGFSVVRANAYGTPVIASARGSLPELITDGANGFLIHDVSDAVRAVDRITRISRADCRKVVEERFSVKRMVSDYMNVYSWILQQTRREDHRPWGYYQVLADSADHKVKRIVVYPGMQLSLQRHKRRSEWWSIVSGNPVVTLNDEQIQLNPGQSIDIPLGAKHRISNPGGHPVVFIEVQQGDYFGEDDIERFEDDFGRV